MDGTGLASQAPAAVSERRQAHELTLLLARAFDLAWLRYYHWRGQRPTISEELAKPALARHLVERAKGGVNEERMLAESGLSHLISLTTDDPPDLCA